MAHSGSSARGCERYKVSRIDEQATLFRLLVVAADALFTYTGVSAKETPREQLQSSTGAATEAYLQSIDTQLEFLSADTRLDLSKISRSLVIYKRALCSTTGKIQPPNFDGSDLIPLEKLFVVPVLRSTGEPEAEVQLSNSTTSSGGNSR